MYLVNKDNKHAASLAEKLANTESDFIEVTTEEIDVYNTDDFKFVPKDFGSFMQFVDLSKMDDGFFLVNDNINMDDLLSVREYFMHRGQQLRIVRVKNDD